MRESFSLPRESFFLVVLICPDLLDDALGSGSLEIRISEMARMV